MASFRKFPWLIACLGAGFLVLSGWSFYRAARGTSAVTDADYYSHGLRYNQTLIEQHAADSLGWQLVIHRDGANLVALLNDGGRSPVSGAGALLRLYGETTGQTGELSLLEVTPGRYQVRLPDSLQGTVTAEIAFERDGARLQRRLLLALPGK